MHPVVEMFSVVYFTIQMHLILFTLQELFPSRPIMRHNCMNKDDPDALQNRSVLNSCTVCACYFKLDLGSGDSVAFRTSRR